MANPFERAFPWQREDAKTFYDALIADFSTRGPIVGLFKLAGGVEAELNADQAPNVIWSDALTLLGRSGRILALCRLLMENHADKSVAIAGRALLDARPAVEQRIAAGGRLIVDRVGLRKNLTQLALEDPPFKVLLVRGEPRSGKSWSRYLFERAATDCDAEVTYLNRATVGTVTEVIEKLFGIFGARDQIPAVTSTPTAWYRTVCNRLTEVAANRSPRRQLWIAVDDLGLDADGSAPLMDPEIREFFDQFVLHLPDPQTYRLFRLMLIHYPEEEPSAWESAECERDRTAARNVVKDDIIDVLREWLSARGETLLDAELDRLAGAVIEFADAPPPDNTKPWLQLIREELQRQLEKGSPA